MTEVRCRLALWALLLILSSASAFVDPRPGFPTEDEAGDGNVYAEARIIGGFNTLEGRYPYFVSLVDSTGRHICGGSLIAPDVVLSAAHCQGATRRAHVGRWDRADSSDDYDDIAIEAEYTNPLYNDEGFQDDFMILKLESQSTKSIIRLNDNSSLPTGAMTDELTSIGFGNTIADVSSLSDILREVDLTYIPSEVCELSKDPTIDLSYQNHITDSMLCAGDSGQDSCQGDSGGPLIISGGNVADDVLVGVISWGFGCALPEFPGVYSRISAQFDWLQAGICEISDAPPDYLNCDGSATMVPRSVPITVSIQFDDFPEETSWSITDLTDMTVFAEVPFGTYTEARARVRETVFLPAGGSVKFEINDSFGDGLCCNTPGNYVVSLGSQPNGPILVSGGGSFESSLVHNFDVPVEFKEESSDDVPIIGEGQIPLTIVIQLDDNPQETGWKVERLDIEVETVIEIPAGIYKIPGATIVRTIVLEKNELYYFRVYDVTSTGIENGFVQLFLGTADVQDDSKKIYEADGDFKGGVDFTFLASTNPVSTKPPVIEGDSYLTLDLFFDLYPGEVGVQLRAKNAEIAVERQSAARDNSVIFFRPPRYYTDYANKQVTERIPIPMPRVGASREFTLIVTDSFGDGVCCNWNQSVHTGYSLYDGDPGFGKVLVDSQFMGVSKEVNTFVIDGRPGTSGDHDNSTPAPIDMVNFKITITLDSFPDETGFYIEDSNGVKYADFPPGSYKIPDDVIAEHFSLPAGVYTFTILDFYGDGLNRDQAFYKIEIVGDEDRPAVVVGNGLFVSQKSHTFVLEGKSADYPMSIQFSTDNKPEEIGFVVKRLDVLEADAVVATVPQGFYQTPSISISETFMVKEGALYLIVFEDAGKDGIGGVIDIIMGSDNANDFNAIPYLLDARNLSAQYMKVLAGDLPTPSPDSVSLELRMTFDKFPQEEEWVLVVGTDPFLSDPASQQVVAFGPYIPYDESLAGTEHVESIQLPKYSGYKTFSLIVTDAAGDGVCCTFGDGGPIELYQGTVENGNLLFSEPFEATGRLVQTFTIEFSGSTSFGMFAVPAVLGSLLATMFTLS